jgi:hypothetical protein
MTKLTLAEQELHIWINAAEPDVVHIDVTFPSTDASWNGWE